MGNHQGRFAPHQILKYERAKYLKSLNLEGYIHEDDGFYYIGPKDSVWGDPSVTGAIYDFLLKDVPMDGCCQSKAPYKITIVPDWTYGQE